VEHAWNDEVGAYTQAFGSRDLDASTLMLPLVGFTPADDPRMLATIHAIGEHLTDPRGMVYRYTAIDLAPARLGLGVDEGCDVGVAEVVEAEVAESGDEVVGDVGACPSNLPDAGRPGTAPRRVAGSSVYDPV
jgi:hypothetical protein